MAKQQQIEIHLLPQIVVNKRTYRASNFRRNIKGKKWAEVDCWVDGVGWQVVHDYEQITMVARLLWSQGNQ
jgi:hypothetical protein